MEIEQVLQELGLIECRIRAIKRVDKRILDDTLFDIDEYAKRGISAKIADEILKKHDVIEDNTRFDSFYKYYGSEVFVFTRSELNKLLKKLTETR